MYIKSFYVCLIYPTIFHLYLLYDYDLNGWVGLDPGDRVISGNWAGFDGRHGWVVRDRREPPWHDNLNNTKTFLHHLMTFSTLEFGICNKQLAILCRIPPRKHSRVYKIAFRQEEPCARVVDSKPQ